MKYIDKASGAEEGRAITEEYVQEECAICDGTETRYQNISYDGFCNRGYRGRMIDVLKKAQGNYCCYCMRDLSQNSGEIALEHIIPQKPNQGDEKRYRALGLKSLSEKVLLLESEFATAGNQTMPPYPHTVAFDNFFNSCTGTFPDKDGMPQCCNNSRGNKFCLPLPLYSNVANMIVFSKDGEVVPYPKHKLASQIADSIAFYHLNCSNLKLIRRLWYLLRNKDYEVLLDCIHNLDLRNKILMEVLYKDSKSSAEDAILYIKYMRNKYWQTFISYHWFQNKYRGECVD